MTDDSTETSQHDEAPTQFQRIQIAVYGAIFILLGNILLAVSGYLSGSIWPILDTVLGALAILFGVFIAGKLFWSEYKPTREVEYDWE